MLRAVLALSLILSCLPAFAGDDIDSFRLTVGIRVFQAFLAADLNLASRAANGTALVLVVGRGEPENIAATVAAIDDMQTIQNMPIDAVPATVDALPHWTGANPCCIFVAYPLLGDFPQVAAWAKARRIPVFSPFAGDVGRGAAAGIRVTDRVLPLIDTAVLAEAGIRLKPFFLKVAARHE